MTYSFLLILILVIDFIVIALKIKFAGSGTKKSALVSAFKDPDSGIPTIAPAPNFSSSNPQSYTVTQQPENTHQSA